MRAFIHVMLITILTATQVAVANAQTQHPANPVKKASFDSCVSYASKVAAREAEQSLPGYVSVIHALFVRASARKDRSVKAAALEPNQFAALTKAPTEEMKRVARQMCADWKNGKPTIEVKLQKHLAGCAYFYAVWMKTPPDWAVEYRKGGGYCGKVAGHYLFRDPSKQVLAYN